MDAAREQAFAAVLLDPARTPDGLLAAGASPRGLDVHRNTVMASLTRALAEGFPSVARLVGPDAFAGLARVAVRADPPRHPVLLAWGARFPAFLEGVPPLAHLPWLADVARLDGLRRRAWHAADALALDATALAALPPDDVAALRVALHPSVGLLASPYAALAIWGAQNGDEAPIAGDGAGGAVLLWRGDAGIHARGVEGALLALLDAARRRPRLDALLADAAQAPAFAEALRLGLLVPAAALDTHLPDLFADFLPPFPASMHP